MTNLNDELLKSAKEANEMLGELLDIDSLWDGEYHDLANKVFKVYERTTKQIKEYETKI